MTGDANKPAAGPQSHTSPPPHPFPSFGVSPHNSLRYHKLATIPQTPYNTTHPGVLLTSSMRAAWKAGWPRKGATAAGCTTQSHTLAGWSRGVRSGVSLPRQLGSCRVRPGRPGSEEGTSS